MKTALMALGVLAYTIAAAVALTWLAPSSIIVLTLRG